MRRAEAQARDSSETSGHTPKPQAIGISLEDGGADEAVRSEPYHSPGVREAVVSPAPWSDTEVPGAKKKSPPKQRLFRAAALCIKVGLKVSCIGAMGIVLLISFIRWPAPAIEDEALRSQIMSALFVSGLFLVAIEDVIGINKSSIMMILAGTMWTFLGVGFHPLKSEAGAVKLHAELNRGLQEVGSVVLFLLPAMGVVESIDHFHGFAIVTFMIRKLMAGQKERLMPIICVLTFFLSSVIDNLTATIVALKLLRHIAADDDDWRRGCGSSAVIAANAGGAWSPIGDVTTTMLWIQGKISATKTVAWLLLPSFVAGILPLFGLWYQARSRSATSQLELKKLQATGLRRHRDKPDGENEHEPFWGDGDKDAQSEEITVQKICALALGITFILMVPALKMFTGLPPYLGMILALGLMWLVTDVLQFGAADEAQAEDAENGDDLREADHDAEPSISAGPPHNGVVAALRRVDLTGLLFFTGVLLAVGALNSAGVLRRYAEQLVKFCGPNPVTICTLLGISSAVVDNVPLVEAGIDMFEKTPMDDPLWQLIALAAGTGGSILSIGSIAGVTLMSMEGVGFLWFLKRVSLWAFLGFGASILTYQFERFLFG